MDRETYIDLMEKVMCAYTKAHVESYTEKVAQNGIEEHGFPRLTANLGILIAHGFHAEYKELFLKMMDLCCREMPVALQKNGERAGNDFSVKEIVFCLLEIEKAGTFDKEKTEKWRRDLSAIVPERTYTAIAVNPAERIGNWAAFGAASEQLRVFAALGNETEFIEKQIQSQLLSFDKNGMYRGPNEPVVYDFVTRLQLAVALYFGYDGTGKDKLEEELLKSADITLYMQSVTGEISFGGRSNQFLHNEAFYAALCEFYASFFKKRGDLNRAGAFKPAAHLAINALTPYLAQSPIRHIKNKYPTESGFGCEEYAYFDKYMVTTASWLYLAYAMAEEVCELPCPIENENFAIETSEHFHKVFLHFDDYCAEVEMKALADYDASGLGRVQKRGAPSAICLAVPVGRTPLHYKTDIENPIDLSVCAGILTGDEAEFASNANSKYECIKKEVTADCARAVFHITTESGAKLKQTVEVAKSGVTVTAEGAGEILVLFPLFDFDGEEHTKMHINRSDAAVLYGGYVCEYKTDGEVVDKEQLIANRNGHHRALFAKGKNKVLLHIEIKKA